jgi:hypothetical protein
MSNKSKKHEDRYRARQQFANKFTQKSPSHYGSWGGTERDPDSVRKLVDKVCK